MRRSTRRRQSRPGLISGVGRIGLAPVANHACRSAGEVSHEGEEGKSPLWRYSGVCRLVPTFGTSASEHRIGVRQGRRAARRAAGVLRTGCRGCCRQACRASYLHTERPLQSDITQVAWLKGNKTPLGQLEVWQFIGWQSCKLLRLRKSEPGEMELWHVAG